MNEAKASLLKDTVTVNQKFGRWTTVSKTDAVRPPRWLCRCDCGNTKDVSVYQLISRHSQSCGCLNRDVQRARNTKHGLTGTRVRNCWHGMIQRCRNPSHANFERYGGRGIKVCERWKTFLNFFHDMGHPPDGKTLDRKNNDGDYSPENCRWATDSEQMRNTRSNRLVLFRGEQKTLLDWADTLGVSFYTLKSRIRNYGWSAERALSTPIRKMRRSV